VNFALPLAETAASQIACFRLMRGFGLCWQVLSISRSRNSIKPRPDSGHLHEEEVRYANLHGDAVASHGEGTTPAISRDDLEPPSLSEVRTCAVRSSAS